MSKSNNSKDAFEFIHTLDSIAIKKQKGVIEILQAQVDFYKKKLENETDYLVKIGLIDQVTHLKAENERLMQEYSDATNHYNKLHNDLQAENERLRKAGDWMCGLLRFDFVTKEWNAAKEGKPSV